MDLSLINNIYVFGCAPLGLIGVVLMTFTIVVLFRIKENQVFVFLALEHVFILGDCFIAFLFPIYKCKNCYHFIDPATQCIVDLIVYNYFSSVVEMSSTFLGILAALHYLMGFRQDKPAYARIFKIKPVIWAAFALVLSGLTFVYLFFTIKIGSYSTSNDTFLYECEYTEFGNSYQASALVTVTYSISYGIMIFVLVFLNVSIMRKLKESVVTYCSIVTRELCMKRRAQEKRLSRLILADCLNLTVSRLPFLFLNIIESYSTDFWEHQHFLVGIFSLFTYSSFVVKFFFFYALNSKFNRESKKCIKGIKKTITTTQDK